jgi:hypothetical protein
LYASEARTILLDMRLGLRRLGLGGVFAVSLFSVSIAVGLVACGDRTGLLVDDVQETAIDAGRDSRFDAPFDVAHDVLPPLDVAHRPDVDRNDCPDADATLVYVITEQYVLYSFNPPTAEFRQIGRISCPTADPTATPFSMAVDRKGVALIVFNDGRLYRVSTATAACQATPFAPGQAGFTTFGMGYAKDIDGPGETLYVASDNGQGGGNSRLASIDTRYVLHPIAPFAPQILRAELTGTGAGELFAFYSDGPTSADSFIGQIDKTTGRVIGETRLTNVDQGTGWAFAFWGGDFFTFTAPTPGGSEVTRYRPTDNSITKVTSLPNVIVGAGVSTCAPQG